MGGCRAGYNRVRDCKIGQFYVEYQAWNACKGLGRWEDNRALLSNAARRNDSWQVTFVSVINVCRSLQALDMGNCICTQFIQSGWDSDLYMNNALIDMYSKCGSLEDSWSVRQNAHTWCGCLEWYDYWTCMIWGKSRQKTLKLFQCLLCERVQPNPCLVPVEFTVRWRWVNTLPKEFLN